jgi:hypothetical protein
MIKDGSQKISWFPSGRFHHPIPILVQVWAGVKHSLGCNPLQSCTPPGLHHHGHHACGSTSDQVAPPKDEFQKVENSWGINERHFKKSNKPPKHTYFYTHLVEIFEMSSETFQDPPSLQV